MRATVSFDIDVGRVAETMKCLVLEEALALNGAIEQLESVSAGTLTKDLDEVLESLRHATAQLQQYKEMLIGFERARFETLLPQPVPAPAPTHSPENTEPGTVVPDQLAQNLEELKKTMGSMQRFDNFLEKINDPADEEPEGGRDDPEEG